jgi:hypothetical protein
VIGRPASRRTRPMPSTTCAARPRDLGRVGVVRGGRCLRESR